MVDRQRAPRPKLGLRALPVVVAIQRYRSKGDLIGGARGSRTPDLLNAIQALSQLSYGPYREICGQTAAVRNCAGPMERRLRLTSRQ